jgi:hypothetical protein
MAVQSPVFGGLTIPPAASLNTVAAPRALVAAGARSLMPVTYGQDRVPALILNVLPSPGQPTTMVVQCLWGHAGQGASQFKLNDQDLPTGSQVMGSYDGAQTVADATMVAAFAAQGITYTDTLHGYVYTVFALPTGKFDGQLALSALVSGRRVYDPRQDGTAGGSGPQRLTDRSTWAYSDNPSLALADWTADTTFGAGEPVDWSSVPAAANANDELIGAAPEKRRVLGVTLTAAASVGQVADALRAYAGCWLVPSAAGLRLVPDRDGAAVASYSHSAGQIASIDPLSMRDLGNMPTAVEVVYTDTSQIPWRDASVEAKLTGAGTTLPWRLSSIRLPGVQRSSQALREATERLNKLTLSGLSTTVEVFDAGVVHDVADIVSITHPAGLAATPTRITGVEMPGPGRWRLSVTQHHAAAYSDLVQTAPAYADATRIVGTPDLITLPALGLNTYRVVSAGLDAINAGAAPAAVGLYVNGVQAYSSTRSYRVAAIRRSDGLLTFEGAFDVFGDSAAPAAMADALNALGPTHIVIVWTHDEPRANRGNAGLDIAMYRCGASRAVFGSPQFKGRSAYVLVGIPGCGEGNGAEAYQGAVDNDPYAWCDLSFGVVGGVLTGVSGTYTPRSLQDYGYTGELDATRGAETFVAEASATAVAVTGTSGTGPQTYAGPKWSPVMTLSFVAKTTGTIALQVTATVSFAGAANMTIGGTNFQNNAVWVNADINGDGQPSAAEQLLYDFGLAAQAGTATCKTVTLSATVPVAVTAGVSYSWPFYAKRQAGDVTLDNIYARIEQVSR